ncbi:protein phosphatase CheZ [Noviherbaspirillum galbum]|uniref:Protein phosphatase CheZ n=1 Tax=Noviherbaspirillum galbum TaxID=2709383 RepID=A0A6B3ST00_9BURK|nr:protein phosphatase CheZ [Noviherbaspirillum galbum]NEX64100.1 protein phosphatase CheZ [Noviherbaspirillum galbum]
MSDQAASDSKEVVFDRLGHLVRSLHDTLREMGADAVLSEAAVEFPSARERLLHIGQLTERAANTVLTRVEECLPVQDRLIARAQALRDAPPSAEETTGFLAEVEQSCVITRAKLSDMMMAQDFQDLTGQLIKKVVTVLERTEQDLLRLLIDAAPPGTISEVKKEELMAGPGAPGSVALEQGDVDDLLADLGF